MYIARVLYPVEVLGPGKRVAIWTCGCPRRCSGCSNPELWDFDDRKLISVDRLIELIGHIVEKNHADGFTITGGEPFFQKEELRVLLSSLSDFSEDILVFTGYYLEQLQNDPALQYISVLVDGPYIKEQNRGLILRGSDNQKIHILKMKYKSLYDEYLCEEYSKIKNFMNGNSVISVGIHKPDYEERIYALAKEKGLRDGGADDE